MYLGSCVNDPNTRTAEGLEQVSELEPKTEQAGFTFSLVGEHRINFFVGQGNVVFLKEGGPMFL